MRGSLGLNSAGLFPSIADDPPFQPPAPHFPNGGFNHESQFQLYP
jgi:hypothetical protein